MKKEKINLNINRQHNKLIITEKLKIDRTRYGIIYNSESFFDDLKDQAIADLFEVERYLEFKREKCSFRFNNKHVDIYVEVKPKIVT